MSCDFNAINPITVDDNDHFSAHQKIHDRSKEDEQDTEYVVFGKNHPNVRHPK